MTIGLISAGFVLLVLAIVAVRDLTQRQHACGLTHPGQLQRSHVVMNISPGVRQSLVEPFPYPPAFKLKRWFHSETSPSAVTRDLRRESADRKLLLQTASAIRDCGPRQLP